MEFGTTRITEDIPKAIQAAIAERAESLENPELVRKAAVAEFDLEEDSRTIVQWVSTNSVDRDNEILLASGCNLSEFERTGKSVFWGHNYDLPPVAKDLWIKKHPKEKPTGILAKTQYADTPLANELWSLRKGGFLNTSSVGFTPIKSIGNRDDGWDALCEKLKEDGLSFNPSLLSRIYTKWILFEHSDVSLSSNMDALTVAVSKGLKVSSDLCEQFGICSTKTISIPKGLGAEKETEKEDEPKEVEPKEDLASKKKEIEKEKEDAAEIKKSEAEQVEISLVTQVKEIAPPEPVEKVERPAFVEKVPQIIVERISAKTPEPIVEIVKREVGKQLGRV